MPKCRITKELRELAAWAEQYGWSWELTASTHIRWSHPDVPGAVFSPHTPRVPESAKPKQKMRMAYRQATGQDMEAVYAS